MWTRFGVAAHLSAAELAVRYRAARDPVARSRWQMIWLLVSGRPLGEVASVTGYSTRWVREVVRSYNAGGEAALADQRHRNAGAAPLLDGEGRKALDEALQKPPPDDGLWTGRKVAAWIAERLGRPPGSVPPLRGWAYLRRLGYTPRVPRPRHAERLWPLANEAVANRHFARLADVDEALAARCRTLSDQPEILKAHTLFHWWPKAA